MKIHVRRTGIIEPDPELRVPVTDGKPGETQPYMAVRNHDVVRLSDLQRFAAEDPDATVTDLLEACEK